MDALYQFGIHLIQALQTLSPALDGIMNGFTFLGRIDFYLVFIPFVIGGLALQVVLHLWRIVVNR